MMTALMDMDLPLATTLQTNHRMAVLNNNPPLAVMMISLLFNLVLSR
jgi:hypothetical protein